MVIGSIDKYETAALQKKSIRRKCNFDQMTKNLDFISGPLSTSGVLVSLSDFTDSAPSASNTDDEFVFPKSTMRRLTSNQASPVKKKFKSKRLMSFSEACDRTGVSDRGAALLVTSLLEDINVVNKSSSESVIDRFVQLKLKFLGIYI